ncbi:hypothetical protein OROMI_033352 [Orobanche minor]
MLLKEFLLAVARTVLSATMKYAIPAAVEMIRACAVGFRLALAHVGIAVAIVATAAALAPAIAPSTN